jgi:hypothetical protein
MDGVHLIPTRQLAGGPFWLSSNIRNWAIFHGRSALFWLSRGALVERLGLPEAASITTEHARLLRLVGVFSNAASCRAVL